MLRLLARMMIACTAFFAGVVSIALADGAVIGTWSLNSMITTNEQHGPAYSLTVHVVYGNDRSPSFSLRCENHAFEFELFNSSGRHVPKASGGDLQIAIDGGRPIAMRGERTSIGRTQILDGKVTADMLDRIAAAKGEIVVTDLEAKAALTFKVSKSARAIQMLRLSCKD